MPDPELAFRPAPSRRFRLFTPILAGASLRERMIACVGALISIALTGIFCGFIVGFGDHLPLLVAPVGASAVLLFAVPASPLAQPWPILGGNVISALVGLLVARAIPDPAIAAGVGVASAIAAMSLTRSLHPPGGAAALTAVLGGPVVAKWGILFPLVPVGLNSCILIGVGLLFHRLAKRGYPHRAPIQLPNPHGTADLPASIRVGFRDADVDAALASLDEAFDIDPADLGRILREIERQTIIRSHSDLTCADIMSRDVIAIRREATREQARALLLRHNIRVLPVLDKDGGLLGAVGLRELSKPGESIAGIVVPARTASFDTPAASLLPVLTDGRTHAVIVTDRRRQVVGLISQTDLLGAMGRLTFIRDVDLQEGFRPS